MASGAKNGCYENFSFSHSVFKRLFSQGHQKVSLCGNGLSLGWLAHRFVTQGKWTKNAEFRYPETKFISCDARASGDWFVEHISHIMTVHQKGVSVCFVRRKFFNMHKTSHWTSPEKEWWVCWIRKDLKMDTNGQNDFLSVTSPLARWDQAFKWVRFSSIKKKQEHHKQVSMLGYNCLIVPENSEWKMGDNYVKILWL